MNNLTAKIHESLSRGQIKNGKLDLSGNSELVEIISDKPFQDVIGQEKAKLTLKGILELLVSGISIKKENNEKPIASLFFPGPSGVGKTLMARTTQKILNIHFGNEVEMIKINCADYPGSSQSVLTPLIGSTAGYVGSENKSRFHPDFFEGEGKVILFDEIEKAGEALWNLLLAVLDDGILDVNYTKPRNNRHITRNISDKGLINNIDSSDEDNDLESTSLKVSFKNCVIIFTSNVGNNLIEEKISGGGIGFGGGGELIDNIDTEHIILEEFSRQFKMELQGRFDDIVTFEHLTDDNAKEIIEQLITILINNTLSKKNGFIIEFTQQVKDKILLDITSSTDLRKFGGRYIMKYFEKNITIKVAKSSNKIKFEEDKENSCLLVFLDNGEISFSKVPIGESIGVKQKAKEILDRTK